MHGKPFIYKKALLLHAVVGKLLVNDIGRARLEKKMTKCDISRRRGGIKNDISQVT